ncbi:MAG: bacteriohemerythrin [Pseudomonadota bacterium]|nr:bacteriohemerythrin [Pseudomonadota bacterium]
MAAIPWKDEYRIDVAVIDQQHRRLAGLVNELHETLESKRSSSELRHILHELIGFTALHFATEEELMLKYEYPGYPEHNREHRMLLGQLHALATAVSDETGVGFNSKADLSDDWVTKHLLESDVQLGRFLNSRGVF